MDKKYTEDELMEMVKLTAEYSVAEFNVYLGRWQKLERMKVEAEAARKAADRAKELGLDKLSEQFEERYERATNPTKEERIMGATWGDLGRYIKSKVTGNT